MKILYMDGNDMTNYEKIQSLSIEEMAKLNVRMEISEDDEYHYGYITTDSSKFFTEKEAVEYESKWLASPVDSTVF